MSINSSGSNNGQSSTSQHEFLCGVVEGFYGRPWTGEQRKDLFQKMEKWGMNSYLYAPKDDYKHRSFWREMYTVEEADHLGSLISVAKENEICFIYAISPGLDITYSSPKDMAALKRKLEQVSQLGCRAFAILFDDIESEMSRVDKECFKSFAHAQVSVTNEIFEFLAPLQFFFCPTQYCATRAVPNVRESDYLRTIGSTLDQRIHIMWTGGKVVSKEITVESIEEISEVICRPPVIWDNLHANDYDQKRIFLGPYAGRSSRIIQKLRGVLTNPNCEYGANFVGIHTLAQWRRCSEDASERSDPDAKLETENGSGSSSSLHIPQNLSPHVYHPLIALKTALKEWLVEFSKSKEVWGPIVKPQILSVPVPLQLSVNTCIAISTTTSTTTTSPLNSSSSLLLSSTPQLIPLLPTFPTVNCTPADISALVEHGSSVVSSNPVMNSLASENKIICTTDPVPPNLTDAIKRNSLGLEPMDTVSIPGSPEKMSESLEPVPLVKSSSEDVLMDANEDLIGEVSSSTAMALDPPETESPAVLTSSVASSMQEEEFESDKSEDEGGVNDDRNLSVDDLQLLCDLFYLPYDHGAQGVQLLTEFQFLKSNAHVVAGLSHLDSDKPEVIEWFERSRKFDELYKRLNKVVEKLHNISNRELLYELYPYVWDMRGVVSLLNSYIKWLAYGQIPSNVSSFLHGNYTWFSKGWREAFESGDQEPWAFRGGLTSELQRLIPVDRGTDLYNYKAPQVPSSRVYTIRNYRESDEEAAYKVILLTFKDGMSAAEEFTSIPQLPAQIKIGGFLSLKTELSFVVEEENELVVGIAVGSLNAKEFRVKLNTIWLPQLRTKYELNSYITHPFARETVSNISADLVEVPESILANYPAELRLSIVESIVDPSIPKRLITCVLAAFRSNGIFGCFVQVDPAEKYSIELYKKLGFIELTDSRFLGRSF